MNHQIQATNLRVIDDSGNQLGVMTKIDALREAESQGLDLVEISPNAKPPVAKIIDWGKYKYQKDKQLQKNKKSQKAQDLKQMRIGMKIGDHDLEVKLNKINKFLDAGHKVKITVFYRGRENAHKDLGFDLANRVIDMLGEDIAVDQKPQLAGRQLHFVVRNK